MRENIQKNRMKAFPGAGCFFCIAKKHSTPGNRHLGHGFLSSSLFFFFEKKKRQGTENNTQAPYLGRRTSPRNLLDRGKGGTYWLGVGVGWALAWGRALAWGWGPLPQLGAGAPKSPVGTASWLGEEPTGGPNLVGTQPQPSWLGLRPYQLGWVGGFTPLP